MKATSAEDRRGIKKPVTSMKSARKNRLQSTLEIRKVKQEERLEQARSRSSQQLLQHGVLPSRFSSGDAASVIIRCMTAFQQWCVVVPGTTTTPVATSALRQSNDDMVMVAVQALHPPNDLVLEAMQALHQLLTANKNPPIQDILSAGSLAYMVLFLAYDNHQQLQSLAMIALTKIVASSKSCVQQVFQQEPSVVDQSVRLLASPVEGIREQCACFLTNFVGASGGASTVANRNVVLDNPLFRHGVLDILQNPTTSESLMLEVVQLLRNLTRVHLTIPSRDQVDFVLAPMADVMTHNRMFFRQPHLLANALWIFANLSHEHDSSEGRIEGVMTSVTPVMLTNILEHTVQERSQDPAILIPILRVLGNYVSGTEAQCQAVLHTPFLNHASDIMQHSSVALKKELCWLLSNVCAGTHDQIKLIFYHHLEEPLIELAVSSRWEVRTEAAWAICNICIFGSDLMRTSMVAKGVLQALSRLLSSPACDKAMIMGVLDAFEKLLDQGRRRGSRDVPVLLDEAGGIDKLESLQEHPDNQVYLKSKSIIETYFGNDDGNGDEGLGEENQDPNAFLDKEGNFAMKMPASSNSN